MGEGQQMTTIASEPDLQAIAAALHVLDVHFDALNKGDEKSLLDTLHFPHYRFSTKGVRVWENGDTYLADFHKRTDPGWAYSRWDYRNIVSGSADKVHIDGQFSRFDREDRCLASYRTLWIVTRLDGRWAAAVRSSFAG